MKPTPAKNASLHVAALLASTAFLLPLVWTVGKSFIGKDGAAGNYRAAWAELDLGALLANTVIVAGLATAGAILISALGGYALARLDGTQPHSTRRRYAAILPLRYAAILVVLGAVPAPVLIPANFAWVNTLGFGDSYLAAVAPFIASCFGILLYRQAFTALPHALLDAARIDGAGTWRTWWSVALPAVRPTTAAFGMLSFLATWNAFLWPALVLSSEHRQTLPVALGLRWASIAYQARPGVLMAATVLALIPVLAVFLWVQRDFTRGMRAGSLADD